MGHEWLVKVQEGIMQNKAVIDKPSSNPKGNYMGDILHFLKDIRQIILKEYLGNEELTLNKLIDLQEKIQFIMETKKNSKLAKKDSQDFLERIPLLRNRILQDIESAFLKDPAATSHEEIALTYPGILAILVHRLSHEFYTMGYKLIARILSEHAHSKTGIDIHPGAMIGDNFFIDHGTGIVIGETTIIGHNVTLYQGVTLGAFSFEHDEYGQILRSNKRHPTIEDNVTIYAGATILGGETVIGQGTIIGGNVWLTKSVAPNSKVLNKVDNKILGTIK